MSCRMVMSVSPFSSGSKVTVTVVSRSGSVQVEHHHVKLSDEEDDAVFLDVDAQFAADPRVELHR